MPKLVAPINDQILVQQDDPKEKVGSGILYAPQGSEQFPNIGTVIRVGPGRVGPTGVRIEPDVQVGDRVMFKRRPGSALVPDSREGDPNDWKNLLMLREEDILGVIVEE